MAILKNIIWVDNRPWSFLKLGNIKMAEIREYEGNYECEFYATKETATIHMDKGLDFAKQKMEDLLDEFNKEILTTK